MGVAIPHLVTDLGITLEQAQWLTTAFMLTMAVVIPITGFLLQRFATRPIFIAAMSLFSHGHAHRRARARLRGPAAGAGRPGERHRDHDAAAHDDAHDPRRRRRPRADRWAASRSSSRSRRPSGPTISGLILDLPVVAVHVLARAADRARDARSSASAASRTSASRASCPIDVFSVILSAFGFGGLVYGLSLVGGVVAGTARPRADVDLARRRSPRDRRVHRAPARAAAHATARCSTCARSGRATSRSRSGSWSS